MASVLTQELFQSVVDHALQDVVPQVAGITLARGGPPPSGEIYTIHTVFEGDIPINLSMCADEAMLTHLTQHVMRQEQVTQEDLADAATELFNVLCGHVAVDLYHATERKFRFQMPRFSKGGQIPDGHKSLFTLNYRGDEDESVQIIHHGNPAMGPLNQTELS